MRALGLFKIAVFYLAMTSLALWAIVARGALRTVLPEANLRAWLLAGGVGVAVGFPVVCLTRVMVRHFLWAERLEQEFRGLVGELTGWEALAIASLSGLGEEMLFRGLLQPAVGLWLGAALFALLHVGPNQRFVPWTVMACAVGVLLGALCLLTGNLLAAIVMHVTINFMNLRYLATRPEGSR